MRGMRGRRGVYQDVMRGRRGVHQGVQERCASRCEGLDTKGVLAHLHVCIAEVPEAWTCAQVDTRVSSHVLGNST